MRYNCDRYLSKAVLARKGSVSRVHREQTVEEKRINMVRFSYSANRGWSYRYDKDGKPTAEFRRELAGETTLWDAVRSLILNV
jgi:hypothetical protein